MRDSLKKSKRHLKNNINDSLNLLSGLQKNGVMVDIETRLTLYIENLDFYFNKNLISCPICEEKFLQITITHLNKHNIDIKAFKDKFQDFKLLSEISSELISFRQTIRHYLNPRIGWKHSEETKDKISKSNLRKNTWTKGTKWSDDRKELISGNKNGFSLKWNNMNEEEKKEWARKGKINGAKAIGKVSEESKKRISESSTEYWSKQENRKKQSIRMSGENNPMFGKTCNNRSFRGIYNSIKGGEIYYKSYYEYIFALYLDYLDDVISFEYEPEFIPYIFNGRKRTVTYDFRAITKTGILIIEVKGEFKRENTLIKIKTIKDYCDKINVDFCLVTIFEIKKIIDEIKDQISIKLFKYLTKHYRRINRKMNREELYEN